MATLFFKQLTGVVNFTSFGPIDRAGTNGWGATLTMDSTSTGTMEFDIFACTTSAGTTCTGDIGSSDAMLVEAFPFGGPGQVVRIESPSVGGWKAAPPASTHPYLFIQVRTSFAAGNWNGSVEIDDGTPSGPCNYGTQRNDAGTATVILTDTLITAVLVGTPYGWLAAILDGLTGMVLGTQALCNGEPPAMPASVAHLLANGLSNFTGMPSLDDLFIAFQALAWPFFCKCTPAPGGSPDPIPFPPVVITPPAGGAPAEPILVCDNGDICSTLNVILRQLSSVNYAISLLRQDVTLIQRQGVPFGYVLGTVHSSLTGAGHFNVSDILGLSVSFSALPTYYGLEGTDPPALLFLGEIALGSADGYENRVRLTRSPQLQFPVSGAITRVGYLFPPGAVATITELIREP